VKYLGIHINGINFSGLFQHCQTVASNATRVLNILRRSMFGCNSEAKCRACKAIVRPLLEYACVVWSPHTMKDRNLLEAVQRHAVRWACSSRWDPVWSVSNDDCYCKFLVCQTGLLVGLCSSSHYYYPIFNLLYL